MVESCPPLILLRVTMWGACEGAGTSAYVASLVCFRGQTTIVPSGVSYESNIRLSEYLSH